MESVKNQITDFLEKCEELKNCKFIMATTKIKDLLKSIVNSAALYELFDTAASNFDYLDAKRRCFIESDEGLYGTCRVVLPDTVGDRLAFIFCLLVEFDRNDINFNAFLQKYYPKDGSYYSSYHLFCDEVIGSLENIISDFFSRELREEAPLPEIEQRSTVPQAPPAPSPEQLNLQELLSAVRVLIQSERAGVAASALPEEEKAAAEIMLGNLSEAAERGDARAIQAAACGYNYFVMQTGFVSRCLNALSETLGEYVAKL